MLEANSGLDVLPAVSLSSEDPSGSLAAVSPRIPLLLSLLCVSQALLLWQMRVFLLPPFPSLMRMLSPIISSTSSPAPSWKGSSSSSPDTLAGVWEAQSKGINLLCLSCQELGWFLRTVVLQPRPTAPCPGTDSPLSREREPGEGVVHTGGMTNQRLGTLQHCIHWQGSIRCSVTWKSHGHRSVLQILQKYMHINSSACM